MLPCSDALELEAARDLLDVDRLACWCSVGCRTVTIHPGPITRSISWLSSVVAVELAVVHGDVEVVAVPDQLRALGLRVGQRVDDERREPELVGDVRALLVGGLFVGVDPHHRGGRDRAASSSWSMSTGSLPGIPLT